MTMTNNTERAHPPRGGPTVIGEMYDIRGNKIANPDEVRMIKRAERLRRQGHTLARIAKVLNDHGFTNRRGNKITAHNVWWIFNKTLRGGG